MRAADLAAAFDIVPDHAGDAHEEKRCDGFPAFFDVIGPCAGGSDVAEDGHEEHVERGGFATAASAGSDKVAWAIRHDGSLDQGQGGADKDAFADKTGGNVTESPIA